MADPPVFRTGYMSVLLPVEKGEGEVRRIIRESVIRALAATGGLSSCAAIRGVDAGAGKEPVATLTLVVSLEAIFLSTFVMIGQNRQAAFQQAKADHDFEAQELELKTNTDITRQNHALTEELHRRVIGGPALPTPDPSPAT
jgi:hypothetical protein